jgi:hypothetical protein
MPHLVNGHMRFTDEDFAMQDFKDANKLKYKGHSFKYLTELLAFEAQQLDNMKDAHIVKKFDTTRNVKQSLASALALITVLAEREGYSLSELLGPV